MKTEKTPQTDEKKKGGVRKLLLLLFVALVAILAYDGYFNHWFFVRGLLYRNVLEVRLSDGTIRTLKIGPDVQIAKLSETTALESPATISEIDRSYREAGLYRIYFRHSDAKSDRLQKVYESLAVIDTGQSVKKSVEDVQRAYANLRRALRIDTTRSDSVTVILPDSTGKLVQTIILSGSNDDLAKDVARVLGRNPQVLVGVGLGLAASLGLELLHGQVFVATSQRDLFGIDSVQAGVRTGSWEGRPIDILWMFNSPLHQAPRDTSVQE